MAKNDRIYPKNTFTFALVEYHKYNPPVVNCRYYRHVEGFGTLSREFKTWGEVFKDLKDWHPKETFEIPDVMPILRYDKNGKEF